MREIKDMHGVIVGGHNIDNLRHADDTVLISESQDQLQKLLNSGRSQRSMSGRW